MCLPSTGAALPEPWSSAPLCARRKVWSWLRERHAPDYPQRQRHFAHSQVETRVHLADFLRQSLGLTGTHLGCEHGVCGACTIIVNGRAVRSGLMLAVQADGAEVETVEGLGSTEAL